MSTRPRVTHASSLLGSLIPSGATHAPAEDDGVDDATSPREGCQVHGSSRADHQLLVLDQAAPRCGRRNTEVAPSIGGCAGPAPTWHRGHDLGDWLCRTRVWTGSAACPGPHARPPQEQHVRPGPEPPLASGTCHARPGWVGDTRSLVRSPEAQRLALLLAGRVLPLPVAVPKLTRSRSSDPVHTFVFVGYFPLSVSLPVSILVVRSTLTTLPPTSSTLYTRNTQFPNITKVPHTLNVTV